jgi:hypothetical protein
MCEGKVDAPTSQELLSLMLNLFITEISGIQQIEFKGFEP